MKATKYTLVYLLLAICGFAFSQEQPTMLFFNENAMFYNPAYTGTYGQVATVNNRTQWAGFQTLPCYNHFLTRVIL
ncbi:MAG: type IX secretion system membrane protein PorP/SprF [Flavobacteriaceae bacterium]|nr:type IX secretion system membrane protein PorP/SprF [Flavobacteriaceae bacterium]